jgi:hypothetical protein
MSRGLLLEGEQTIPIGTGSGAEHAMEYARTAALLRRRAIQPHRTEDERVELRRRADWYERRAAIKREGGIMPPELRTPLESLEVVDTFRRRLASVVDLAPHLSLDEVEAFSSSLKAERTDREPRFSRESMEVGFEHLLDVAFELLGLLGVRQSAESGAPVFSPFVIETAVSP